MGVLMPVSGSNSTPSVLPEARPFGHPYYWAAFSLTGDPGWGGVEDSDSECVLRPLWHRRPGGVDTGEMPVPQGVGALSNAL